MSSNLPNAAAKVTSSWIENYEKLVQYHHIHHHCNVRDSEDPKLAKWVRKYQGRKRQDVSENRQKLLDKLNFRFSGERIKQKKKKKERTKVKKHHNEIGIWVGGNNNSRSNNDDEQKQKKERKSRSKSRSDIATDENDDFFAKTHHLSILDSMIPERDSSLVRNEIDSSLQNKRSRRSSLSRSSLFDHHLNNQHKKKIGVKFAKGLVTDVWERPTISDAEKMRLFYSEAEIWNFKSRQQKKKESIDERNSEEEEYHPSSIDDKITAPISPDFHHFSFDSHDEGEDTDDGDDDFSSSSSPSDIKIRKKSSEECSKIQPLSSHTRRERQRDAQKIDSSSNKNALSQEEENYVKGLFNPKVSTASSVQKRTKKNSQQQKQRSIDDNDDSFLAGIFNNFYSF